MYLSSVMFQIESNLKLLLFQFCMCTMDYILIIFKFSLNLLILFKVLTIHQGYLLLTPSPLQLLFYLFLLKPQQIPAECAMGAGHNTRESRVYSLGTIMNQFYTNRLVVTASNGIHRMDGLIAYYYSRSDMTNYSTQFSKPKTISSK